MLVVVMGIVCQSGVAFWGPAQNGLILVTFTACLNSRHIYTGRCNAFGQIATGAQNVCVNPEKGAMPLTNGNVILAALHAPFLQFIHM